MGGGANTCLGEVAEKDANASPGTPLGGGYANGTTTDGFARVKEGAAEPAATAEGDAHAGASTVAGRRVCPTGVGMAARASLFAAAETASGLARLPDLSPPAYGSIFLQRRLPLTALMRSVDVFSPVGLCFLFGPVLMPIRLAVSAQVFQFGWKTSFSGNTRAA